MENQWKSLAEKELKNTSVGSLDWQTTDGISLSPLYTTTPSSETSFPGIPPYTRGVRATMYTNRPWTIRQYAGFSSAEATNAFYHECLRDGQTALSVAFDLATHRGYDSDHRRVAGDVGKAGVAIDTVEDIKRLFDGIPLDKMSVSMTMNGAVIPIMAFYIVAAEEQGVSQDKLSGTLQNDILKEFLVRNTFIYPPNFSMRIVGDIIAYCAKTIPRFNPISISGYHMHEAGATPAQELAYTLADGLEYVRAALKMGLEIDEFAPRLSFFFGIGMDFFSEVAKLRAARTLWYELMGQFNPTNPQSLMLRTHCQTSGVSLTYQDPLNNVIRTTIEAMAAVFGGTQSLHTNSYDEALGLPTQQSSRVARHTQLIIAEETNISKVVDPLGGSYYVESLTQALIDKARAYMAEIEELGGMTKAIQLGIPKRRIEEAAAERQIRLDNQEDIIVGVNKYQSDSQPTVEILEIDTDAVRGQQLENLATIKKQRDQTVVDKCLMELQEAAKGKANLLEAAIKAARARATLGEISLALEDVFGRYQAPVKTLTGVWQRAMTDDPNFKELKDQIKQFATENGRQPRILLTKLGQDGHDRGIKIIATAFADAGFDVDLAPLFLTPGEAAKQAIENDVHVVGISSLAAGHKTLIPSLIEELKKAGADDIKVICGGILPPQDHQYLLDAGVTALFTPGSSLLDVVRKTLAVI
ncbi:methylmalonyl-CoA mutase [Candidatus Odyssella acanthamoebae]|uniref:Methylmalonyl-CoA mutase n=1 Tax=Candidatus Odyssella acanthamoebae TaxID=91604 RepID=A0A077ATK9_9PROT|nr:methylmalonyl-CoA mutase [Candidatus Paracaedibacter acanthamoebae]AIK95731.1 methylmalonyl-CoA mutase [Candidatus Paracaedibacter acanthamoebae]